MGISDVELEALVSTYATDFEVVHQSPVTVLHFKVVPRTGDDITQRYVETVLEVVVPEAYPNEPPSVSLNSVKGLDDRKCKEITDKLASEAVEMIGELTIGQLCESALDVVTDLNKPSGDCGVCLMPLVAGEQTDVVAMVKLPCFHVFHKSCFPEWWSFQQRDLQQKEKEMQERTGVAAASRVLKLPEKLEGLYVVNCPICRADVKPTDLQPYMETIVGQPPSLVSKMPITDVLPEDEVKKLKKQQKEWAEKLTEQTRRGGVVGDTPAALSLSQMTSNTSSSNINQDANAGSEERDELSDLLKKIQSTTGPNSNQLHRRCSSHGDLVSRFSLPSSQENRKGAAEGGQGGEEASQPDPGQQERMPGRRGRGRGSDRGSYRGRGRGGRGYDYGRGGDRGRRGGRFNREYRPRGGGHFGGGPYQHGRQGNDGGFGRGNFEDGRRGRGFRGQRGGGRFGGAFGGRRRGRRGRGEGREGGGGMGRGEGA